MQFVFNTGFEKMGKYIITIFIITLSLWSAKIAVCSDIPKGHWAERSIQRCVDASILGGDWNGNFNGKRLVNRFQAVEVVSKLLEKMKDSQNWSRELNKDDVASISRIMDRLLQAHKQMVDLKLRIRMLELSVVKIVEEQSG